MRPDHVDTCPALGQPCDRGCVGAWCQERGTFDPPRPAHEPPPPRPGRLARMLARLTGRPTVQTRAHEEPS